jgi:RHS repeat-associated protein
MSRVRIQITLLATSIALLLGLASLSAGQMPHAPASAAGQSHTQLSDGRWLLLGGDGPQGRLNAAIMFDPVSGLSIILPRRMIEPRAWHSATVLADGTVLVVGGHGAAGLLGSAERFDPATETFSPVEGVVLAPRAAHTATLLTDGRVLLAGGEGPGGSLQRRAEVWDVERGVVVPVRGLGPHTDHTATLLGDGTVLLSGKSIDGSPSNELFDPGTDAAAEPSPSSSSAAIEVREVRPGDRATDVPVDAIVTLRLSQPVARDNIDQHVELSGPFGKIAAHLVVAEGGRLLFVRPDSVLDSLNTYTVTLSTISNVAGTSEAAGSWRFTTGASDRNATLESELWTPRGDGPSAWRTNLPPSPWQQLPPLQAAAGVSAVAGQVLRLNGRPLADVTLDIDGHVAHTDGTGRFLVVLDQVDARHEELWVDGRSANHGQITYGTYEIGVPVRAGVTIALPYTIWMPVLDTAHAVSIPSPVSGEMIISTPKIPGLELRLPAGTVIRDHDGQVVRSVTITPVPLDRPPFPLPSGVEVPLYFTVQPGGAYVHVYGNSSAKGGRLIYPNGLKLPPQMRMDFWRYQPEEAKWSVYGQGRVTPNRAQVIPDPGVEFYEFTGAMVGGPGLAQSTNPSNGNPNGRDGDPVDLSTGLFVLEATDIVIADVVPLVLTRTYRPGDARSRAFGIGASHPYDVFLVGDTFPYTFQDLILADGARIHFNRISPGTEWTQAVYEHTESSTVWYKAQISWNGDGWNLTRPDGTLWVFQEGFGATRPQETAILSMRDKFGNVVAITRDSNANVTRVESPSGRFITFIYDSTFRITQVQDNIGRSITYEYDGGGRLWKVHDAEQGLSEYTYDSLHRMLTAKNARGIVYLTNIYDSNDRVTSQTIAGRGTFTFAYTLDASGRVMQVDVTNPRNITTRTALNASGYTTSVTQAFGTSLQRTTTLSRQAGTNLIASMLDALNHRTDFTYNAFGDMLTVTRLAGTANAVTTTYTYEPQFHQPASVANSLGHSWTLSYDTTGRLTGMTDPLSHTWNVVLNAAGQPVSITDPLQHNWRADYSQGQLSVLTSPRGARWVAYNDGAGRMASVQDPNSQIVKASLDRLDRPTTVENAQGGQVAVTYDGNSNILSVSDALTHAVSFTYDDADRVVSRIDQNSVSDTYIYDGNDNPASATDRRGQTTSYQYDALDRLSLVTFQDGSTISYSHDAVNRLLTVTDSANGNIAREYDGLDRLTKETTPEGVVDYTYDQAGRRQTMTVSGQPTVTYSYDDDDRLIGITQAAITVALGYDEANRRASIIYPNGIVSTATYDGEGHVLEISYASNGNTIGNLTYTYDGLGRRTAIGGTWARTTLPAPLSSASYDAANRPTTWSGVALSHDPNGSVTNDGQLNYVWNARHQLIGVTGATNGTFLYDGVGRRRSKTVAGVTASFVYDGLTSIQELGAGGNPTTNVLAGLGLDESFVRVDGSSLSTLLNDGLGSTVALADQTGAIQTQYTYGAFGASAATGTASSSAVQFTGREHDGSALYYYRSRYYQTTLQRFTSEDPIGFGGGDINLYAYAQNDPISKTDPTGLATMLAPRGTFPACERMRSSHNPPLWDRIRCALEQGAIFPSPLTAIEAGAATLAEQLAIEEAMGGAGIRIMEGRVADPRFPEGLYAKMHYVHEGLNGQNIVVHYWQEILTGIGVGFKIK